MNVVDTAAAMKRVIAFVNTRDLETGTDELDTPEQLAAWLHGQGLLPPGAAVSKRDLMSAHELREGLRAALLAHDAHNATPEPPVTATTVPLTLAISADGSVSLAPVADGAAAALAGLVAPIPAAAADGTWQRVKACPRDDCQWAFLDQSRNRSRRWCSMEVCGNVEKSRSFRQRHRSD